MATKTLYPASEALIATPVATSERTKSARRLLYIDNIRTFLTVLVLLHHIMIVYAASGSWLYTEGRQDTLTDIVGNIFCTLNQAYFMGLFLLISAYFVPGAYDRKGSARFWKDRLVRLGIPLVIYSWVVHPLLVYEYLKISEGLSISLWNYYSQYFSYGYLTGVGPLWFVEVLLIFTLVYALFRQFSKTRPVERLQHARFPSNGVLALFALCMGLAGFVMRLKFPVDWTFKPLNLQLSFFAQYIAMFGAGLLAYRRGWLENIPASTGRFWLWVAGVVMILYIPGALLGGALESDLPYKGGWHWQSLYFAIWEAFLCVGFSIGVLYLFRRYADQQSSFVASLSRSAYAAYLVQAPVITGMALLLRDLSFHPLLKFALLALLAIPLSFGVGTLLRRLPFASRVL